MPKKVKKKLKYNILALHKNIIFNSIPKKY